MPRQKKNRFSQREGFTLVELLVVIAIIGMLVAILLPAVQSARGAARRSQCQNNLRQLGLAIVGHEASHQVFPSGATVVGDDFGDGQHSGLVHLLPYLEQQNLYDQVDFGSSWKDEANWQIVTATVETFLCASSPSTVGMHEFEQAEQKFGKPVAVSDYAFSKGPEAYLRSQQSGGFIGMFDINSQIKIAHIKDGLSNTFAMGEAASSITLPAAAT